MLNARNGRLSLKTGTLDYIRFGSGPRTMVMIPGIGDGLKTVKGMALPFAWMYRKLARDFTVYVFSRGNALRPDWGTREMAGELAGAMEALGLEQACVVGVSQGGMIAQWLAVDYPRRVGKLVLTVTLCRPNETVRRVIGSWMEMARRGDYKGIMIDFAERSYTPARSRRARRMYALLGNVGKPASFDRFLVQAQACLTHDAGAELAQVRCPTLVIGGTEDRIVTGEASREITERIPDCRIYMYEGLSHGLYEDAGDFLERVAEFLR